jgi:hypothetical protein
MPVYDDEDAVGPQTPADDLRRVARYQRWVIATVLAQITLWIGYLVLGSLNGSGFGGGGRFAVVLTVALGCVGGVYTFLIYWTLRQPVQAVVIGLACLPPLIGLFGLMAVNMAATRMLGSNGVSVGVFGADLDSIEDTPGLYDEDAGW